ncbi:probable pectinesterase/pectinesterase inhibitor 51 [Prosopis cineraria]|uniref:probable pectinesterase/pectinesterase inhibitor 51 n=1 Tax=Prosopis cineraria TaxID=364024 RepID=UPI00240F9457|nr:probable pectinesterase/pectinesterase inhibitor 51 [Prosopis cineraria]
MACSAFFTIFLLVSVSSSAAASSSIQRACYATRFPPDCLYSLITRPFNDLPPDPSPLQIIQSAIAFSADNVKTAQSKIKSILDSSSDNGDYLNRTMAAKSCFAILLNSEYRISLIKNALQSGRTKDARAWMSAALAYQFDCWSGLKYVYGNDAASIDDTLFFLDSLTRYSSNALSMMVSYDVFGSDTALWKEPRTERDGFWEAPSGKERGFGYSGGFPLNLKVDVTVCEKKEKGCYKTVQEAVNAAPDNSEARFVIHIRKGVYEETVRIPIEKKNVIFLGDGMRKTIITGSAHVGQPGMTTYNSATVGVLGDGFMAKNLTIQNTAGPDAHQAVAFRSDSDLSVLDNVEFIGNQDTLYAHSLRQFYKSCRIQGNVDMIFGNAASIFQECAILLSPRGSNSKTGETNVVTAHGRSDPAQSTGFVFHKCVVTGTKEYMAQYRKKPEVHKNFLGRPWKVYSRTVFIHSVLEALISAEGWMAWDGDLGLDTLYYGESNNAGPGSDRSRRVAWSSEIPHQHVSSFSVDNFIQGSDWIPSYQLSHR